MKCGKLAPVLLSIGFICGCGHGILIESETTGLAMNIPIGEGAPLGVTIGMCKTTTATVRGGTTVETTSVAGGGIFSGDAGIGKKTTMKTNAQLNEGNLRQVLMSPDCPDIVKIMLASNLVNAAAAPELEPMVIQTKVSSAHSGHESVMSNAVAKIDHTSGIDKIVETLPEVTTPIVESTAAVITNTVEAASNTTVGLFDKFADMCRSIKWTVFFKALCAIASVVGLWLWLNKGNKKTKPLGILEEVDPNLSGAPVPPERGHVPPTSENVLDIPDVLSTGDNKKEKKTARSSTVKKAGIIMTIVSVLFTIIKGVFLLTPAVRQKLFGWIVNLFKKK